MSIASNIISLLERKKMVDKKYYQSITSRVKSLTGIPASRFEHVSTQWKEYKDDYVSISYWRKKTNREFVNKLKEKEDEIKREFGDGTFIDYNDSTINVPFKNLSDVKIDTSDNDTKQMFWATTVGDGRNSYLIYGAKVVDKDYQFPSKSDISRIKKDVGGDKFVNYYVPGQNKYFSSYNSLIKFIKDEVRSENIDLPDEDTLIENAWDTRYFILHY